MSLWEYLGAGSSITKWLYHLNWNANDSSWNWNNWVSTNISWVGGKIWSGSASFNWTNSKIETNLSVPNNNNFTFACWIYDNSADNTNWRIITADSWGWYFILQSNRPSPNNNWKTSFNIFSWWDNQILETTAHNKNQWYRYVCILTWWVQYLYRDWVLQWSQACGNIWNISNWLDFWTNSNTSWFQWLIDEIIIENRWWTVQEVIKDYTYSQWKFIL